MKKGFTLAEVLIAMTVVGVIAILTIPSIINTYKFKIYTMQLNRAIAQVTTAISQVIDDEHADNINTDDPNTPTGFYATSAYYDPSSFLNKYIKQGKKCDAGNTYCELILHTHKKPDGTLITITPLSTSVISTINGAIIMLVKSSNNLYLYIDVNGNKDPNITGYDTFFLKINEDGSITDTESDASKCNTGSTNVKNASAGCYSKFLKNGNQIKK